LPHKAAGIGELGQRALDASSVDAPRARHSS